MITASGLTKRYGSTVAVDDLSFEVQDGVVTGFLGPNGAGKSTTMRMIIGLDHPTDGMVLIDGTPYRDQRWPLREVGALLDAKAVHPGRSARNHLRGIALANKIPTTRVDEVLDIVGLTAVAGRKVGKFSLGMSQRLGIAGALLGDPKVLLFDEPVNGLDPEGIAWVRQLLKGLAAEGRTIFLSSHLMSEMAQTATDLVVIGRGRLIADTTVEDFVSAHTVPTVEVRSADQETWAIALRSAGAEVGPADDDALSVTKIGAPAIGEIALASGIALHKLTPVRASLEEVFMEMTSDAQEYATSTPSTEEPA